MKPTDKMTADEFKARKAPKRQKYGAKREAVDGIKFDSKKEARRWGQLKFLEQHGEITNLERQVPIPLWGKDGPIMTDGGKRQRTYVADFRYVDWRLNGVVVIEDAKGFATKDYLIKRSILAAQGVEIKET